MLEFRRRTSPVSGSSSRGKRWDEVAQSQVCLLSVSSLHYDNLRGCPHIMRLLQGADCIADLIMFGRAVLSWGRLLALPSQYCGLVSRKTTTQKMFTGCKFNLAVDRPPPTVFRSVKGGDLILLRKFWEAHLSAVLTRFPQDDRW